MKTPAITSRILTSYFIVVDGVSVLLVLTSPLVTANLESHFKTKLSSLKDFSTAKA